MIEINEIQKIKETIEEFFQKITISTSGIEVALSTTKNIIKSTQNNKETVDIINVDIVAEEPQILIGADGQTLLELQRILRIILNKQLKKSFYVKLDINDYEKKKIEYVKNLAKELADEVSLTKKKKILSPMPAYQRRIIHMELKDRTDIITESQGVGIDRCVVIRPIV